MVRLKTSEEIDILREGGRRHAEILRLLSEVARPGVSTSELDMRAKELIDAFGDKAAFFGYRPHGVKRPYPAHVCISINDVIVHGIPNEPNRIIRDGDVVSIDLGLTHKGLITDAAVTIVAGKGSKDAYALVEATQSALRAGIDAIQSAKTIGDITKAIESYIRTTPFAPAKDLAGHGVGYAVHEEPFVPNFGKRIKEPVVPGLVIAIEPMLVIGSGEVVFDNDEYTVRTKEGGLSAHCEHTIVVTEQGCDILTI